MASEWKGDLQIGMIKPGDIVRVIDDGLVASVTLVASRGTRSERYQLALVSTSQKTFYRAHELELKVAGPAGLAGGTMAKKVKKKSTNTDVRERLTAVLEQLNTTFVGDPGPNRMIMLAYLARVNYLLIGDKGTAKTARASAFASHVTDGRYFCETLGKFTSPEKVFGLLDPAEFKLGRYVTKTDGMLPWADHAFLDEMLKPSEGMINELLNILGPSRSYQRKQTELHVCGGATNWPEVELQTEMTAPLYDRLLLRCEVTDPLDADPSCAVNLMRVGRDMRSGSYEPRETVSMAEIRQAHEEVLGVEVGDTLAKTIADFCLKLRNRGGGRQANQGNQLTNSGIRISPRRMVEMQSVVQANAWLEGRSIATVADLEAIVFCCWDRRKDIEVVQTALSNIDSEILKQLVNVIDQGRAAFRELEQKGYSQPAAINQAIGKIKLSAKRAREIFQEPVFTPRGREQAKAAMAGLRADFDKLKRKAGIKSSNQGV